MVWEDLELLVSLEHKVTRGGQEVVCIKSSPDSNFSISSVSSIVAKISLCAEKGESELNFSGVRLTKNLDPDDSSFTLDLEAERYDSKFGPVGTTHHGAQQGKTATGSGYYQPRC
ncbi:hypothetical protein AVEN_190135-1 [Araneus ventricosus]|uniref:Uncharacterized protein n=1 Tax=Araneus ventricosus TaxID=182803 RepID=A0A4Y2X9W4_ARAVE|nr:hypothetical protein AVEN_188757-1 [Araneus ventricosus]GBO45734.1 hypothetical protein AVEN_10201-1 [Araneus ventricosus]GBO45819.1 hypothetical protein AVEN_73748-1 [Araneus ventricosus]GBO45873.1 hypothetical protein AVEN_190135-1 [Araneus ventricosus]